MIQWFASLPYGNAFVETDDEIEDVFGANARTEGEQLEIPF